MVSREDAEVRRILDEVILLVCPANPDGMEMIAKPFAIDVLSAKIREMIEAPAPAA